MTDLQQTKPFYILSLDGGSSLGVCTLGVLQRVEEFSRLHSAGNDRKK